MYVHYYKLFVYTQAGSIITCRQCKHKNVSITSASMDMVWVTKINMLFRTIINNTHIVLCKHSGIQYFILCCVLELVPHWGVKNLFRVPFKVSDDHPQNFYIRVPPHLGFDNNNINFTIVINYLYSDKLFWLNLQWLSHDGPERPVERESWCSGYTDECYTECSVVLRVFLWCPCYSHTRYSTACVQTSPISLRLHTGRYRSLTWKYLLTHATRLVGLIMVGCQTEEWEVVHSNPGRTTHLGF